MTVLFSKCTTRLWVTVSLALFVFSQTPLFAEKVYVDSSADSRGEPEMTLCTQNLKNYGLPSRVLARTGMMGAELETKEKALVSRFLVAKCDVIVVQELLATSEKEGADAAERLVKVLRSGLGRDFDFRVATSGDRYIRNAIFVAKDIGKILSSVTYQRVALPKIVEEEKTRFFERAPFEVQAQINGRGESAAKVISVIGYHFKSQAGAKDDPTGMAFETTRMQMAEALRRLLENRFQGSFSVGEPLLIVAGDRNANFDLASSKLLEGTLALPLFAFEGPCRLSKRGVPLCRAGVSLTGKLFSLITGDKEAKLLPGTYHYKDQYSFLDDIAVPQVSLPFARKSELVEGSYNVGIVHTFPEASDHALVWARFNW